MATPLRDRLAHAWNAFSSNNERKRTTPDVSYSYGHTSSVNPGRMRIAGANERSMISAIYTRLAIDVASVEIRHVKVDENERYIKTMKSGLEECLDLEANIDQGARHFRQEVAMTLFTKGVLAIVPVETTLNPEITSAYDILSLRVGEIVAWYPQHVTVNMYNEKTGQREDITLAKRYVAIIENPLYEVMNQPNSTLNRLTRKLSILDSVDEASGSGKLDLIIQLPYTIRSEAKRIEVEKRRSDIEMQLKQSQYGIAYLDGTEKVTQLNRPAENNLLAQIEYLTAQLYNQLGLTEEVFNGTANEAAMLNYHNRTIEPILTAITQGMKRTFLSKTARAQNQSIEFFRDPFKLVPIANIAEIADKFTRNEIATANEVRSIVGWKPHTDEKADQLINSNMPVDKRGGTPLSTGEPTLDVDAQAAEQEAVMNETFDALEKQIEELTAGEAEAA